MSFCVDGNGTSFLSLSSLPLPREKKRKRKAEKKEPKKRIKDKDKKRDIPSLSHHILSIHQSACRRQAY